MTDNGFGESDNFIAAMKISSEPSLEGFYDGEILFMRDEHDLAPVSMMQVKARNLADLEFAIGAVMTRLVGVDLDDGLPEPDGIILPPNTKIN